MLLTLLKQTLPTAISKIESIGIESIVTNGNNYYRLTSLKEFKSGVALLSQFEIFSHLVQNFRNQSFFSIVDDYAIVPPSETAQFQNDLKSTLSALIMTRDLLQQVVPDVSPNTIFLKIAEPVDLQALEANIEIFQKIFAPLVLHPDIAGELTFAGVEPGSTWVKLNVKSVIAVSLIGTLFWSSVVIYKKYKETEIMNEIIRAKKIDNEKKEMLLQANRMMVDFMIEAEATQLYNTYYENGNIDHEQIERIKHSIKLFSEEISKGAEVNPSLTAPEEVTNLFPDLKNLPSIQSKVKLIEKQ